MELFRVIEVYLIKLLSYEWSGNVPKIKLKIEKQPVVASSANHNYEPGNVPSLFASCVRNIKPKFQRYLAIIIEKTRISQAFYSSYMPIVKIAIPFYDWLCPNLKKFSKSTYDKLAINPTWTLYKARMSSPSQVILITKMAEETLSTFRSYTLRGIHGTLPSDASRPLIRSQCRRNYLRGSILHPKLLQRAIYV